MNLLAVVTLLAVMNLLAVMQLLAVMNLLAVVTTGRHEPLAVMNQRVTVRFLKKA